MPACAMDPTDPRQAQGQGRVASGMEMAAREGRAFPAFRFHKTLHYIQKLVFVWRSNIFEDGDGRLPRAAFSTCPHSAVCLYTRQARAHM